MRKIMPFLLLAVVVAGCASDGKTTTAASSSSSSSAATAPVSLPGKVSGDGATGDATSGSIDVELEDYYFNPAYLKVSPGETVTIHLKNTGTAQHTFTSDSLGVDQVVDPGKTVDVKATAPATLPVEFHCRFHQASGMQGALFETAAAVASTSSSSSSSSNGYYN
jgi:plastocyanin